jgi:hypothetical protein
MKKCLFCMLLLVSMMTFGQKENFKKVDYASMTSKQLLEILKNEKTNKELITLLSSRYHEISEEKFMTITQSFWDKSVMDYKLYDYSKIRAICTLNDNTDDGHSFTYIKFSPIENTTAADIVYTPVTSFDSTASCFLIDLFDLLIITMDPEDVVLLTKGYEFIQVPNPAATPDKPYIYKKTTIVLFQILNKKGETKGFYDISRDPGL